eukprot:tig00021352_g20700.t1
MAFIAALPAVRICAGVPATAGRPATPADGTRAQSASRADASTSSARLARRELLGSALPLRRRLFGSTGCEGTERLLVFAKASKKGGSRSKTPAPQADLIESKAEDQRDRLTEIRKGIARQSVLVNPPPAHPHETKIKSAAAADFDEQEFIYSHAIFCNRSLDFKQIKCVGFDMDYTLAVYNPDTFERLAFESAREKLVAMGYPREILEWDFDPHHAVRGLIIDKARGNILKMDRHKYVKVGFHGLRMLSKEERRRLYTNSRNTADSYTEPAYALVDTWFSLTDAYLYSRLVEHKEGAPESIERSFAEIYRDVRAAVDLCHRDGSIKEKVCQDPGRYIVRDPNLVPTLKHLKKVGKKLFLATNSLWGYTHAVMNYICGEGEYDPENLSEEWLELFEVVITGAAKPSFFMSAPPLYEVQPETGLLRNVDGVGFPEGAKVFQGGNYDHVHSLLGVERGSEVLYVGDHIYGDILRSKKEIGWRTILLVPELEHEIEVLHRNREDLIRFDELRHRRDALDDRIQILRTYIEEAGAPDLQKGSGFRLVGANASVRSSSSARPKGRRGGAGEAGRKAPSGEELEGRLARLRAAYQETHTELCELLQRYHEKFHPVWGQMLKTGYQNSRFATQMENYACLYTSRATNLRFIAPNKHFRCSRDVMPHDPFWTVGPAEDGLEEDDGFLHALL